MPMKWTAGTTISTRLPSGPCHQNTLSFQGFVSFQADILWVTAYFSPLFLRICGSDQVIPKMSGCQQICGVIPNSSWKNFRPYIICLTRDSPLNRLPSHSTQED